MDWPTIALIYLGISIPATFVLARFCSINNQQEKR